MEVADREELGSEEGTCDQRATAVHWVKFRGFEAKFSETVDASTREGKLVLQIQEALLLSGIAESCSRKSCCSCSALARDTSYDIPILIEVADNYYLGSYSKRPKDVYDLFAYYPNTRPSETKWFLTRTRYLNAYVITNSRGHHWSYNSKKKTVFLQEDYNNQDSNKWNFFLIDHDTKSISPYKNENKRVYGYSTSTEPPQYSETLPVEYPEFRGDGLKVTKL